MHSCLLLTNTEKGDDEGILKQIKKYFLKKAQPPKLLAVTSLRIFSLCYSS